MSDQPARTAPASNPPMPNPPMPMIERRRIEAAILKHVYETLKESQGEAVARKTVADAVKRSSIEQGRQMADQAEGGTSLQSFIDLQALWTMEDALRIDVKEQTEEKFVFHVTRCRYAEMYKAMGLGEIGHLLSCQRDGTFCEGYDDKLKLTRTQTIMQGASHCDFSYRYEAEQSER